MPDFVIKQKKKKDYEQFTCRIESKLLERVKRTVLDYNLTSVNIANVEKELDNTEKAKVENKQEEKPEIEKSIQEKNTSDDLMNLLFLIHIII